METETIVLGGGCFWCTEAVFAMLKGIVSVEPGYAGPAHSGTGPSYEEVSTGASPYVETAKIIYEPDRLALEEILQVFFASHDPTTPGRQGADVGPQYASVIFYTTLRQREKAEHYMKVLSRAYDKPLTTAVLPLNRFYAAEKYHKEYFKNNPSAGYCQLVIAPKVEKVGEKFRHLLKE